MTLNDLQHLDSRERRDTTKTPTAYYFPSDLIADLSDEEVGELLGMQATFISGKNVTSLKNRIRQVVEYSDIYGFQFALDFRIDSQSGERMRAVNGGQHVLDKIRARLPHAKQYHPLDEPAGTQEVR